MGFSFETESQNYISQLNGTKWYNLLTQTLFDSIPCETIYLKYKVFVDIVCAGHSEGEGIITTLSYLASQTLDNSLYEVILFINTKSGLEDITTQFVHKFTANNLNFPIYILSNMEY